MATKKNENLEKYRERYQQIKEKILGLGYVCIGNVQTRYLECGKDACSCHQSAKRRHGPYHYWVRRVKGRTISVLLKDEDEVKLCRTWIDDIVCTQTGGVTKERLKEVLNPIVRPSAE